MHLVSYFGRVYHQGYAKGCRATWLNKNRIPANAIIFQTIVAIIFAAILFIVIPAFGGASNASVVYNVVISASTLVWQSQRPSSPLTF